MGDLVSIAKVETKVLHSPTLNTVLMVEETMKNMNESIFSVAKVKRELPRKVNHNTLKIILGYLEDSNKIVFSSKGITWIENNNFALNRAISKGMEL